MPVYTVVQRRVLMYAMLYQGAGGSYLVIALKLR
jgi:hypothetical protein